jgi:hypothetical protein
MFTAACASGLAGDGGFEARRPLHPTLDGQTETARKEAPLRSVVQYGRAARLYDSVAHGAPLLHATLSLHHPPE